MTIGAANQFQLKKGYSPKIRTIRVIRVQLFFGSGYARVGNSMQTKPVGNKLAMLYYLTTNVHLIKEIGMIPYYLQRKLGYETTVVTYRCNRAIYAKYAPTLLSILDESYSALENEVKGLTLTFIKDKGLVCGLHRAVIEYLWKNSRSLRVLMLMHYDREKLLYGLLYKLLNPNGFLYLKMDADVNTLSQLDYMKLSFFNPKDWLRLLIRTLFWKKIDLVSIESIVGFREIRKLFPWHTEKLIHLPNGLDTQGLQRFVPKRRSLAEKENIILTVGRLGTYQKNTEMFLQAIEMLDLGDWKVVLIGSIENSFQAVIESYFERNPQLRGKVLFTGVISNREVLYSWYDRAKIFCMTSRYEGFANVRLEALYFGNYIVSTPTSGLEDISPNGYVKIIEHENAAGCAAALREAMDDPSLLSCGFEEKMRFAERAFSWDALLDKIADRIRQNYAAAGEINV